MTRDLAPNHRAAVADIRAALKAIDAALSAGQVADSELFVDLNGCSAILSEINESHGEAAIECPMVDPDVRNRNEDKGGEGWPCPVCGSMTKLKGKAWWVHVRASDGYLWNVGLPEDMTSHDDQGWFPIGPSCAIRLPLAFRQRAFPEGV